MRLLIVAALACVGLAVFAQSALATHARIQVAKINQGGNPSDTFAFHPTFTWTPLTPAALSVPSTSDFSLAGGQTSQQFDVACDLTVAANLCGTEYGDVTLQIAELAKPGYTLTDITCRHVQSDPNDPNNRFLSGPPTTSSPIKPASEVHVNLAAGTVNLNMNYNEWAVCWFTNTAAAPPGASPAPSPSPSPSPQIQVSPERATPGSARLQGPHGCPDTNAVAATVSGRKIAKVTFYIDGRKVKTLTRPNKGRRWSLSVNMRKIAYGSHRVVAKVQFTRASGTKTKTLRLSFSRCGANNVRPQFTG
jgi:hypothetical protein